jgi:hypothetical protein
LPKQPVGQPFVEVVVLTSDPPGPPARTVFTTLATAFPWQPIPSLQLGLWTRASAPIPVATAVTFRIVRSTCEVMALPFIPAPRPCAVVLRIRAELLMPV